MNEYFYPLIAIIGGLTVLLSGYKIGLVKGEQKAHKKRQDELHQQAMDSPPLPDELSPPDYNYSKSVPVFEVHGNFTKDCSVSTPMNFLSKKLVHRLSEKKLVKLERGSEVVERKGKDELYRYTLTVSLPK